MGELSCFPSTGFFPPAHLLHTAPTPSTRWDLPAAAASRLHCSQHLHSNCLLLPAAQLHTPQKPRSPLQSLAPGPVTLPNPLPWGGAAPDSTPAGRDCSATPIPAVPAAKPASRSCQCDPAGPKLSPNPANAPLQGTKPLQLSAKLPQRRIPREVVPRRRRTTAACRTTPLKPQTLSCQKKRSFPRKGGKQNPQPFRPATSQGFLHQSLKTPQRFQAHLCFTNNCQKYRYILKKKKT